MPLSPKSTAKRSKNYSLIKFLPSQFTQKKSKLILSKFLETWNLNPFWSTTSTKIRISFRSIQRMGLKNTTDKFLDTFACTITIRGKNNFCKKLSTHLKIYKSQNERCSCYQNRANWLCILFCQSSINAAWRATHSINDFVSLIL